MVNQNSLKIGDRVGVIMSNKKQIIKDYIDGVPERQFETGHYLTKIGNKYVTYYTIFGTTETHKITLEDFIKTYIK